MLLNQHPNSQVCPLLEQRVVVVSLGGGNEGGSAVVAGVAVDYLPQLGCYEVAMDSSGGTTTRISAGGVREEPAG